MLRTAQQWMCSLHPWRFLWHDWIQLQHQFRPHYWPCFWQKFEAEPRWGPLHAKLFCHSMDTVSLLNQKLHYLTKFRPYQNCSNNFQMVFFKTNSNLKKSFSSILTACLPKIGDDMLLFSFGVSPWCEERPPLFLAPHTFNLLF